jgi:threonine/homoserine/homoserine lactone efflux protein
MDLFSAATLLLIMITLAAVPSASVAIVVTRSATHGLASGISAAAGIVVGDLVFVALAILGMTLLAETMGAFFMILKICAGGYLVWLGIGLLRSRNHVGFHITGKPQGLSHITSFISGLLLTLADVKAIFFYASLFPTFVDMTDLGASEITGIILVTIVAVGGVKIGYAAAAGYLVDRMRLTGIKAQKATRTAAGCLMIGIGGYMIAEG